MFGEVIVAVLLQTMEFVRLTGKRLEMPPPSSALLLARVLLFSVSGPLLQMPPPVP